MSKMSNINENSGVVAYTECLAAHEAAYWEGRRQGMNLSDKQIGDLLRAAGPHIIANWLHINSD
jgi:hypothetical protein